MLLEHWDGLGVQLVVALAVILLQHQGGLYIEQLMVIMLGLPSQPLTSALALVQCCFA